MAYNSATVANAATLAVVNVYKWERLFEIHNKSNEAVDVPITCNLPYVSIGCELDDVVTGLKNQWWQ